MLFRGILSSGRGTIHAALVLMLLWAVGAWATIGAAGDVDSQNGPASRLDRLYVGVEYGLWWPKAPGNVPALVTSSPTGTPIGQTGVMGQSQTITLFGDGPLEYHVSGGGRLTFGIWLDDVRTLALEANVLAFGEGTNQFRAASSGDPLMARPFLNLETGRNDSQIIAYPSLAAGSMTVDTNTEAVGAELLFRHNLCRCCCARTDLLFGYRYFQLSDDLNLSEHVVSTVEGGFVAVGTALDVDDYFSTNNDFHGFDLGIEKQWYRGSWSMSVTGKVALGNARQRVTVDGWTSVSVPGQAPSLSRGGFLAIEPNLGSFHRDRFAVVPEGNLRFHLQLTENVKANVGYSFLYLNQAIRVVDHLPVAIDPRLLPTPLIEPPDQPTMTFDRSGFWAHGLTFGLDYRY